MEAADSAGAPDSGDAAYWNDRARRYGLLAAGYLDRSQYEYEERLRWNAFQRLCSIPERARVLDVGCGLGRWSARLAATGSSVVGTDVSALMIDMAAPHSGLTYEVCAAQDIAFPAESFDLILSVTVLQHITDDGDRLRALRNMRRMLAPSGRVFVLEYSPNEAPAAGEAGGYMRLCSHTEWLDAFRAAGYEVAAETGVRFVDARFHAASRAIERRLHFRSRTGEGGPIARAARIAAFAIDSTLARSKLSIRWSDVHAFALAPKRS